MVDVIDAGAGTGAFAEEWVAVNGPPRRMTLIEPSGPMLARGAAALRERGVVADNIASGLADADVTADEVLVAHVNEHFPDPVQALGQIRRLVRPGGYLRLVVSKPHWCNAINWLQWRHRTFQNNEVRALLKQEGFALAFEYAFPSGPQSRTSMGFVARCLI